MSKLDQVKALRLGREARAEAKRRAGRVTGSGAGAGLATVDAVGRAEILARAEAKAAGLAPKNSRAAEVVESKGARRGGAIMGRRSYDPPRAPELETKAGPAGGTDAPAPKKRRPASPVQKGERRRGRPKGPETVVLPARVSPSTAGRVETYRAAHGLRSTSEAVRDLLEYALERMPR